MNMRLHLIASLLLHSVAAAPPGFNGSPWAHATPESVGMKAQDLEDAKNFINKQILKRQCFLLIKNGKIVYEWYDPDAKDPPLTPKYKGQPEFKQHHGYSMTKTIGGFLLMYIKTKNPKTFDLDAGITKTWGIPSPKTYEVTMRMMMAQVIGGDDRPGSLWRYDELGDSWLYLFPKIILAATGRKASYWLNNLQLDMGLTNNTFSWPTVNIEWYRGGSATCRDWARFGQLMLNKGTWNGRQVISADLIAAMTEPVKYAPYNSYSNPCYGLLIWTNPDKAKYPGCCWEASRLPEPKCNNATMLEHAPHDISMNIGLYGQIVMTLPSVDTVVVGFGNDLRPIEPFRLGYYPGVCKALGLPCNKPPPPPKTKCGESLQCTGVSAQCFSGGAWGHVEPYPGKKQCVDCFRNRLWKYEAKFPEAHYMVQDNCPSNATEAAKFVECFCGETGINANPFAPWHSTTTTTPAPSPAPPCPHPYPAPSPGPPLPACGFKPSCIKGLQNFKPQCLHVKNNGGKECYDGLKAWGPQLTKQFDCPDFSRDAFHPELGDGAFCWCGLPFPPSAAHESPRDLSPPFAIGSTIRGIPPKHSHCSKPDHYKQEPHGYKCCVDQHDYLSMHRVGGQRAVESVANKCMHHVTDCKAAHKGTQKCKDDIKACSENAVCADSCVCKYAACMAENTAVHGHPGFGPECSTCFGRYMQCSGLNCATECACWKPGQGKAPKACTQCRKKNCGDQFHHCACGQSNEKYCAEGALFSLFSWNASYDEDSWPLVI